MQNKSSKLSIIDLESAIRSLVIDRVGTRLPSERELADQFGVTRPRVHHALMTLQSEGLVEIRPGSGAYSVSPDESKLSGVTLVIDDQIKLGDDPFFSVLVQRLQSAVQGIGARCSVATVNADRSAVPRDDAYITLGTVSASVLASLRNQPTVTLMSAPSPEDTEIQIAHGSLTTEFCLDDRAGGRDALRRLASAGCTSVVFAGRLNIEASRLRFEGAHAASDEIGMPIKLRTCRLNYTAGLHFGSEMARSGVTSGTGIIATNDWLAAGIRAGLGSELPSESIPIVSFDGLALTDNPILRIDSLTVPLDEIAADAVAELTRLAERTKVKGRVVVYPLSWRE